MGSSLSDARYTLTPHKDGHIFTCNKPGCGTRCLLRDDDDLARMVRAHYPRNCPSKGNQLRLGGGALTSIIQQMWAEVDDVLDQLMEAKGGDTPPLKGQLQGMTRMIQLISAPYYPTHDDVKREAVTRREDRLAGRHHMTPGCETITIMPGGKPVANAAERIPTPWERDHRSAPVAASTGAGTSRPAPTKRTGGSPAKHFTADEVTKIRAAHAAGFDLKMLAVANKCTEENIKAVLPNV